MAMAAFTPFKSVNDVAERRCTAKVPLTSSLQNAIGSLGPRPVKAKTSRGWRVCLRAGLGVGFSTLFDGMELIHLKLADLIDLSARPPNLQDIDNVCVP